MPSNPVCDEPTAPPPVTFAKEIFFGDKKIPSSLWLRESRSDWLWELCSCCGARIAYTEDDFNSIQTYGGGGFHSEKRGDNCFNRGICVILNPDQSKIKYIKHTVLEYVQLGIDVLAVRILPFDLHTALYNKLLEEEKEDD